MFGFAPIIRAARITLENVSRTLRYICADIIKQRADDDSVAGNADRMPEPIISRAVRSREFFNLAPIVRAARITFKDIRRALVRVCSRIALSRADDDPVAADRNF